MNVILISLLLIIIPFNPNLMLHRKTNKNSLGSSQKEKVTPLVNVVFIVRETG